MTKVLVVEDDPFLQRTIQRALELHKLPVAVTADGNKGIELAKTEKPSVILLNVTLSQMNGLEILEKLKNEDDTKKIPVIVLVNFTEEEVVAKAKLLGAADVITKSDFDPDVIVNKVKAYL
jgi:CheY-like chemotaxis protein